MHSKTFFWSVLVLSVFLALFPWASMMPYAGLIEYGIVRLGTDGVFACFLVFVSRMGIKTSRYLLKSPVRFHFAAAWLLFVAHTVNMLSLLVIIIWNVIEWSAFC